MVTIDWQEFFRLREWCFQLIDRELVLDGHHKSYEGALSVHFGSRFHPEDVYLELHCYVAPVNGRGATFKTLKEFEGLLVRWEEELTTRENDPEY
jgi:hypothetical protein